MSAGLGGRAFSFFDPAARAARVHQFSFDVQRELPKEFVLAAGFTGSITHHLIQGTGCQMQQSLGGAAKDRVPM